MASAVAVVLSAVATPASAHEGHSHDEEADAAAAEAAPFKALIFSETAGFVHPSMAAARTVWDELATANGFEVVQAQDSALFTDEGLAEFDVIVLANASGDVWNAAEEAAFEKYVRDGGGVMAVHNPLDMEQGNTFYRNLIGTEFSAHSAANTPGAAVVTDDRHPSTTELPGRWSRNEEWYGFTRTVRGDKHVLVSMDPTSVPANTPGRMAIDHPVTWCADYEGGRTFVTSIGHASEAYAEPLVRQHLLGGAQYAAGVLDGDCKATDWGNYDKVPLDTNTSAPWGIALAPDGRVFFTELVRGQVRIFDPEQQRTVTAATLDVYGGGENGLLGLALDPDFESNHFIYVYYSPADAPAPAPAYVSHNQLSRFTMNGNTMDLASEVKMLEVPATRAPGANDIGHTGGTMRFDGNGDLWMSIGDDVNPFESNGYSPIDERPGRHHFDAQGTAANSNDLRGKLLRIHPEDDGSYSIPDGNMFDEAVDTDDKTRPEVYAMGFRNPFRFSVNTDGTIYLADYGPDAGSPNANRGPAGYVEWQVIREPGNYGWPYCHANDIAYNDFDFQTSTSGPKFDCANPVNTSPNNTGLTELPASIPADVYYSYGAEPAFPQLGAGSGSPMAGPAYDFDPDLDSERKWPEYFDGTPLFFEWGRNFIAEFQLAGEGETGQSGSPVRAMNRVLSDRPFLSPVDLQFGPDGALYVLEWGGGYGRDNPNSGLYRVDYSPDGRAPTARATADVTSGQAPLTVEFSSEGTLDADGDEFDLVWDFGDGTTSTEANPTHTYTAIGNYEARLTATERTAVAKVGTANVDIVVGNTAPQVEILGPPNGGFFEWGDTLPWKVRVTDEDDVPVDCGDVIVQPAMGHDDHAHPTTAVNACEGETETFLDEGHAEANAFWVLDARYTDAGGQGGSNPITSSATSLYRPKRFQAQYWTEQNGVALENNAAAEQGSYVGAIQNGDWIKYGDMNFRGIDSLNFRVSAGPDGGGFLDVRLGSPTGDLLGTVDVPSTSAWFNFYDAPLAIADAPAGTHDVYLVFRPAAGKTYPMILDTFEAVGDGVGYDPTPEVPVVRTDSTTRGSWIGKYGNLGYTIPTVGSVLPEGVTVDLGAGAGNAYAWTTPPAGAGSLEVPEQVTTLPATPSGQRKASTWFHTTGYDVSVTLPAQTSYDVSFYVYAHDGARSETLKLVKGDGTEVAPIRTVADGGNGQWVTYRVDSSFKAELRKVSGPNAVLSGVFFDEVEQPGEPDALDTEKPTVTGQTVPMLPGANGWFQQSPVQVQVEADDAEGSGVEKTEIKVGTRPWARYTEPVTADRQGETVVKYRAIDGRGNQSEPASLTVKLDSAAPTVTAASTPTAPGPMGWYAGPVTVDLTAADAAPGSGIATVRYAVNGGGWVTGDRVEIDQPGVSTVAYQAIDLAGNESAVGELAVKIDGTAPTVSPVFNPNLAGDGSVTGPVTVQLNGNDSGSGVMSVEYRLDGGAWTTYAAPVVVGTAGLHTLVHRATDLAGNVSQEGSVTFTVRPGSTPTPDPEKADTTLKVKAPKAVRAGAKVKVKVAVRESAAATPSGTITVRLKGKLLGRATLGEDGRLKLVLKKKLKAGKHKLTVTYAGDDAFNGSQTTVKITVNTERNH